MGIDDIKTVAVIGAGDMGHGIAEVALIAGYKVFLRDINQEFVDRGIARINASLEKLVSKEKVPAEHHEKIRSELLVPCVDLSEAVQAADLIIEAIPEVLDLKKDTFEEMDKAAPAHAIFASNTSTMSITDIASITGRPEKVLGLHYFNPAVLMKLVEVIRGDKTSEETMQVGYNFVEKNSKVPVRVHKDVPGFIVNRIMIPHFLEAIKIVEEGIASIEDVDKAVKSGLNYPMGPFELMDLTGIDIAYFVTEYFYRELNKESKWVAPNLLKTMIRAGKLGRKTGGGWYDYGRS